MSSNPWSGQPGRLDVSDVVEAPQNSSPNRMALVLWYILQNLTLQITYLHRAVMVFDSKALDNLATSIG